MGTEIDYVWGLVVLPVLIGFFKGEIGTIIQAWNVYRLRNFDLDGSGKTHDALEVQSGATGEWGRIVVEKIVFSLSSRKRGVYLIHGNGSKEKMSLIDWSKVRKRSIV